MADGPRDLQRAVRDAIVREFAMDPGAVTSESRLVADLGLDSLDLVALTARIEEALDVEVDEDRLEGIETVADVVRALEGVLGTPR